MLVTVITINKDNKIGLEKTIESVLMQNYKPLEYIVIDGASTDGSIDVIEKYSRKISYWTSEADNGVYHAQNKGWKLANGEYVIFLNSGDWFCSENSLSALAIQCKSKTSIIYGDLQLNDGKGGYYIKTYPDKLPSNYFDYETLPHPASLISIRLLKDQYGFDENFKICSDWKFFRAIHQTKMAKFIHINSVISCFGLDGISSDPLNEKVIKSEKEIIKIFESTSKTNPAGLMKRLRFFLLRVRS